MEAEGDSNTKSTELADDLEENLQQKSEDFVEEKHKAPTIGLVTVEPDQVSEHSIQSKARLLPSTVK